MKQKTTQKMEKRKTLGTIYYYYYETNESCVVIMENRRIWSKLHKKRDYWDKQNLTLHLYLSTTKKQNLWNIIVAQGYYLSSLLLSKSRYIHSCSLPHKGRTVTWRCHPTWLSRETKVACILWFQRNSSHLLFFYFECMDFFLCPSRHLVSSSSSSKLLWGNDGVHSYSSCETSHNWNLYRSWYVMITVLILSSPMSLSFMSMSTSTSLPSYHHWFVLVRRCQSTPKVLQGRGEVWFGSLEGGSFFPLQFPKRWGWRQVDLFDRTTCSFGGKTYLSQNYACFYLHNHLHNNRGDIIPKRLRWVNRLMNSTTDATAAVVADGNCVGFDWMEWQESHDFGLTWWEVLAWNTCWTDIVEGSASSRKRGQSLVFSQSLAERYKTKEFPPPRCSHTFAVCFGNVTERNDHQI